MFLRDAIDCKYKNIAKEQGVYIEIAYKAGLSKTQEIEETSEGFVIKLSSDRISESDYEEYLSYNLRKIILPRLLLKTERLVIRPFDLNDAQAYWNNLRGPMELQYYYLEKSPNSFEAFR